MTCTSVVCRWAVQGEGHLKVMHRWAVQGAVQGEGYLKVMHRWAVQGEGHLKVQLKCCCDHFKLKITNLAERQPCMKEIG